ncbi:hypothetical protein AWB82_06284 [Caballeronia glebae]|uniref:Capsule polysaccharide biosynthesis protein n=1 Tax=Caballeronia glebae TaxID=1777143 RepID=A0A158D4S7_9BURK|nr:hypothetical protein [Caballeronia glebae]SAK89645.1 hypothetical protein AWB82_06284 [Caballeronia glebae]
MKILVSAFTGRCLVNWLPLADEIRKKNGRCDFLLFPRVSDPDHRALLREDIQSFALVTEQIKEDFSFVRSTEADCAERIRSAVRNQRYEALLMTTCHVGPELKLKNWLKPSSPEIEVIGLQHGFVQPWWYYEELSASFDKIGVFGSAFVDRFTEPFRSRVIPLSLPSLDPYVGEKGNPLGATLFALQRDMSVELVDQMATELEIARRRKVIIRPHPEHVSLYDGLRSKFAFSDPAMPVNDVLRSVSAVVTSGSTLALASLSMRIPTVVLDHLGGAEYRPFGIVAEEMSSASIIQTLQRQEPESFWNELQAVLVRYTGRAGFRAEDAYNSLRSSIVRKSDARDSTFSRLRGWLNRHIAQ